MESFWDFISFSPLQNQVYVQTTLFQFSSHFFGHLKKLNIWWNNTYLPQWTSRHFDCFDVFFTVLLCLMFRWLFRKSQKTTVQIEWTTSLCWTLFNWIKIDTLLRINHFRFHRLNKDEWSQQNTWPQVVIIDFYIQAKYGFSVPIVRLDAQHVWFLFCSHKITPSHPHIQHNSDFLMKQTYIYSRRMDSFMQTNKQQIHKKTPLLLTVFIR